MRPTQIKQVAKDQLLLEWDDGHSGHVTLQVLRDACPCAECAGETVLFKSYVPATPKRDSPGRYDLSGAEPVGSYALKLTWKDGHNQGIYTWEQLRSLCMCSLCTAQRQG